MKWSIKKNGCPVHPDRPWTIRKPNGDFWACEYTYANAQYELNQQLHFLGLL